MATPITFTIFNNSSTAATIDTFTFTDDPSIVHVATLTNFGVVGDFTGTFTTTNTPLAGDSQIDFIVNYTTTTNVVGTYTGTIDISATLNSVVIPITVTNAVAYSLTPMANPNLTPIAGGGANPSSGGGGGGFDIIPFIIGAALGIPVDCFTPDTLVLMADGTTKNIVDVAIGEQVLNHDQSQINTVKFIEKVLDTHWSHLYSPSPKLVPFATINHPLYINNVLSSVDPKEHYEAYPWLGPTAKLTPVAIVTTENQTVYNLWVDGDGTYIVNGYGTTSIMNDGAFLSKSANDGYLTPEQVLEILAAHANNGRALRVGSFLVNEFLGFIDIKPLSKAIAKSLSGPNTILKGLLVQGMRTVGLVANLIYKAKNYNV